MRSLLLLVLYLSCVPAFIAFTPKPLVSHPRPALAARTPQHFTPQLTAAALEQPERSGSGPTESTINLFKNVVGSGVLALAAGIAAFSSSPLALLPSLAIMAAVGLVSAYAFILIARVGAATGATTYRDVWQKVYGKSTTWITDVTVLFMTMCAGLSYSIIIGDLFASIGRLAGLPPTLCKPNAWILLISTFLWLPLSLLRDLSSLAAGSAVGCAGTAYTALFVTQRCLDKSYAAGGRFHEAVAAGSRPVFAAPTAARPLINPSIFVLVSMLASAFLAHYNAPKFYNELQEPADGSSKLPTFSRVVLGAFGLAFGLMGLIMGGAFLTFGASSQGVILNNYATADPLALLARLGIGMSILFSYPLNMLGLREGLLDIIPGGTEAGKRQSVHWAVTVGLMVLMNGTALFLKDLGLVVALGGAILGSALVYIFPALMAIGEKSGAVGAQEKKANWGLCGLGVFFAGLGAVMCLK